LSRPHAVDEHTGKDSSGGVDNTHLRSLRNALLIAHIFFGNIFRCLDAERLSQRLSP
jgi:hypothetical protein